MHTFAPLLLALAATSAYSAPVERQDEIHAVLDRRLSLPLWPWEIPGSKPAGLKKIIVFGDSLSDNGNTFRILNNTYPYPSFYFQGRYSNGPTWVEYLSQELGTEMENHAFGGSSSDSLSVKGEAPTGTIIPEMPGLVQQVTTWKDSKPQFDPATTLFSVWSGANDYFNAKTPLSPATVVDATMKSINALVAAGAKNLIVFNMAPGQEKIPFIEHNLRFGLELLKFSVANPSVKLVTMDMAIEFGYIALNRKSFGYDMPLTDITKPCLQQVDLNNPATWIMCSDPSQFIMFDVHPTTKTHTIIKDQVKKGLVKHNIIAG
ncbi:hypothetical protein SpCBS45565_g07031 [Spizellomyces sp. 'palustris']|nr:hypothetical protein SpCBS45565_g07031 [Spizellomyces sp. 'palustris']